MMLTPGYYITAELKVKDGSKVSVAKTALTALCEKTLSESGCSLFLLHHDSTVATRFLLWERFDNESAFKKHFEEEYTKAYIESDLTEVVQLFLTDLA
jgi:4-carboxymuconolactone decarboxylase